MKRCWVFCHGWGASPLFWENLLPFFSESRCVCLDLGYFQHRNVIIPASSDYEYIGIGHSIGFMQLYALNIRWKKLIGIQGFNDFLGRQTTLYAKRERELKLLLKQFHTNPRKTLINFYRLAGWESSLIPIEKLNEQALLNDLNTLSSSCSLYKDLPLLIIGAEDDPIVTTSIIQENFSKEKHVKSIMYRFGKHALGYLYPELIAKDIKRFVYGA